MMKQVKDNRRPDPAPKLELFDRMWLLWNGHRKLIGHSLALFLCLCLIFLFRGLRQSYIQRKMERTFPVACENPDLMEKFARRYGSQPLGSFAAFMMANREAVNLGHRESAEFFALAKRHLASFSSLADLLSAVQTMEDGRWSEAETLLKRLLADRRGDPFIRCGACYELALLNFLRHRMEEAAGFLRTFEGLPPSPFWSEKIGLLSIFLD